MKHLIRTIRQHQQLSQEQLAAELEISQRHLQRIELDIEPIRYDLALKLANIFDLPLHQIFPKTKTVLQQIQGSPEEGFALLHDPKNIKILAEAGIDAELSDLIMKCYFKGGRTEYFPISGVDRERLWLRIQSTDNVSRFIVFHSDDKCVAINRDSLLYTHFLQDYSTVDILKDDVDQQSLIIHFMGEETPATFDIDPYEATLDDEPDAIGEDSELQNLMCMLDTYIDDQEVISITDEDGEIVFFDIKNVAMLTIPLSSLYPELLGDDNYDEAANDAD